MSPRTQLEDLEVRFSHRLQGDLEENAISRAVSARRKAGLPLADLTESNPTFAGFVYQEERIVRALAQPGMLAYQPDPRGLLPAREAVARYHLDSTQHYINPDRVIITASTSEAYSLLFKLLCDPGDAVLVPAPSYPLFGMLTSLESVQAIHYPLRFDGEWHIDLSALEEILARESRVRAILIVSPGNPTGNYLKPAEHARLSALCAPREIALICDEVFADYGSRPVLPAEADAPTFQLSGLSKVCGLPQLKAGWCIASGPEAIAREAMSRLELIADTYLSVGTPVQLALPELLATRGPLQAQIRRRCANNRAAILAARKPSASWDLLESEGGWSAILRVPEARSEEELVLALIEQGVLVQPGFFYDFDRGSHLVVSLLPRENELAAAIATLASILS